MNDTATIESPEAITRHTHADKFPELENIKLDLVDRSRNHRMPRPGDEKRILELMNSIEASGQLQAVRVYEVEPPAKGERRVDPKNPNAPLYILGFGWRRCEAMARLGYELIRAEVYPPAPDHEIEAARAIENIARQDITPIEEAQAVADIVTAYIKDNPTAPHTEALQHAAAEAGRSETWVRDRDYFTRLTEPVRELAMRCSLPAGHLRELSKLGDPTLQLEVALFAVKGSDYWFKKGTLEVKKNDTWARDCAERFWANVEGGQIHREPIQRVKQRVEEFQRSLKSVPWELTLPVLVSGKGGLRACDECPHNTANDVTLFGVEDGGPGRCMNPGCFEDKKAAAEAERAKAAKHATRKVKKFDDATKATQAVERAPGWLNTKKLKGFVKREQKKIKDGGQATAPGAKTRGRAQPGNRPLTTHEKAIKKYDEAVDKWMATAIDMVHMLASEKAYRMAAIRLLLWLDCIEQVDGITVPLISTYHPPDKPTPPTMPAPLSKEVVAHLDRATSEDPSQVVEIAQGNAVDWGANEDLPRNPDFLMRLITGFGGHFELCPEWRAFAPPAEDEAPKKKPARKKPAKKKATKKKTTKKKKAGAK